MSFFLFPAWVIRRIDKIRRAFFWCGRESVSGLKCLRKWDNLCCSKIQGGLGIINIHWQNIALLGKWLWRLLNDEDNLWVKFTNHTFFRRRNLFHLSGARFPGASAFFKDIWSLGKIFRIGLRKECGEGSITLFWKDIWIGEIPLEVRFPSLYILVDEPRCVVKSQYKLRYGVRIWDIKFNGSFNESHIKDLEELMLLLNNYEWKDGDKIIWRWNSSGNFSVKSYYDFLSFGGLKSKYSRIIWQNIAPLKVKILLWLVINNCLLTGSNLKKRHIEVDRKCCFCEVEEDDLDHIFLNCPSLRFIWHFFLLFFKISSIPFSISDWFGGWRCLNITKKDRILWDSLTMAYVWVIWKERNNRIFENNISNNNYLLNSIIFFVDFWTGSLEFPRKKKIHAGELVSAGECFMRSGGGEGSGSLVGLRSPSDHLASVGRDGGSLPSDPRRVHGFQDEAESGGHSNRYGAHIITYVRRPR